MSNYFLYNKKGTIMKRLLVVYALISTPLLTDCMTSNKAEKNNNTQHTRGSKMARIKTNSGLEYEIIQEGSGASPKKRATGYGALYRLVR